MVVGPALQKSGRLDLECGDKALGRGTALAVSGPPLPLTQDLHVAARVLAETCKLSFYDALIVAAAQEAGCEVLYSEDLQHGRSFGTLRVENPFLTQVS